MDLDLRAERLVGIINGCKNALECYGASVELCIMAGIDYDLRDFDNDVIDAAAEFHLSVTFKK